MLNVIMLSDVMLNIVILSVVAPSQLLKPNLKLNVEMGAKLQPKRKMIIRIS